MKITLCGSVKFAKEIVDVYNKVKAMIPLRITTKIKEGPA